MTPFFLGVLSTAAATIGLLLLHFWRKTGDDLFFFFSAAFWLLALNWLLLAFVEQDERQVVIYAIRLLAFTLIIVGVWSKNRQQMSANRHAKQPPTGDNAG